MIILNVYNPGSEGVFIVKVKVPRVELQTYHKNFKITTDIMCTNDED